MSELAVILGALAVLVLSIGGLNIHRRRTDVLTGPYISDGDHPRTIPDTDRLRQAIDLSRLCTGLQSTLLSVRRLIGGRLLGTYRKIRVYTEQSSDGSVHSANKMGSIFGLKYVAKRLGNRVGWTR